MLMDGYLEDVGMMCIILAWVNFESFVPSWCFGTQHVEMPSEAKVWASVWPKSANGCDTTGCSFHEWPRECGIAGIRVCCLHLGHGFTCPYLSHCPGTWLWWTVQPCPRAKLNAEAWRIAAAELLSQLEVKALAITGFGIKHDWYHFITRTVSVAVPLGLWNGPWPPVLMGHGGSSFVLWRLKAIYHNKSVGFDRSLTNAMIPSHSWCKKELLFQDEVFIGSGHGKLCLPATSEFWGEAHAWGLQVWPDVFADLILLLEAGTEKNAFEFPVHVFSPSRASGSSTLCVEEVGRATAPTLKLIQKWALWPVRLQSQLTQRLQFVSLIAVKKTRHVIHMFSLFVSNPRPKKSRMKS